MRLKVPLETIFNQLNNALDTLSGAQYSQPVLSLSNATIGQHTRHIIELFQELLKGYPKGIVNYDDRRRDLLLEHDISMARGAIVAILAQLFEVDKPLQLKGNYLNDQVSELSVDSTYYREVIYNLEHAIHHMAYIRIAMNELGNIQIPPAFGVAASTNRFRKVCVQ